MVILLLLSACLVLPFGDSPGRRRSQAEREPLTIEAQKNLEAPTVNPRKPSDRPIAKLSIALRRREQTAARADRQGKQRM